MFKVLSSIMIYDYVSPLDYKRVVDHLPLMTYGLKLSFEAWIWEFENSNLSFKEII